MAALQTSLEEMSEAHELAKASLLECQDMVTELQVIPQPTARSVMLASESVSLLSCELSH